MCQYRDILMRIHNDNSATPATAGQEKGLHRAGRVRRPMLYLDLPADPGSLILSGHVSPLATCGWQH